jgi:phage terminase small subunit
MTENLTPRVARFVDEYLADPNGTQAAIRAGYSRKTAAQQASRLLRNVKIQQAIATSQKELAERRLWTPDRLIDEAETNLELARTGGWRGVSPANGALELIGRVTGLLSDKAREQPQQPITRVVIVLNRGADAEGRPRITEAAYRVLPSPDGEADGPSDA